MWFYLVGGHAWFYSGGMRGFIRGVCMVLSGGHAWFYLGGMLGFIRVGVRGFIPGGMHGFIRGGCVWFYSGGMCSFIWGACMVLFGGVCMVLFGGVHGFPGGMHGFFSFFRYNEIRSMSGRYASYWNAFLLKIDFLICLEMVRQNVLIFSKKTEITELPSGCKA